MVWGWGIVLILSKRFKIVSFRSKSLEAGKVMKPVIILILYKCFILPTHHEIEILKLKFSPQHNRYLYITIKKKFSHEILDVILILM